MEDKNKLLEMLNDIIEVAKTKSNELTMDEIKSFLNGLSLDEKQINLVYDYLIANKVKIKGYINPTNEFLGSVHKTEENQDIYDVDNAQDNWNDSKDIKNKESNEASQDTNNSDIEDLSNEYTNDSKSDDKLRKEEEEEKEFLDMYLADIEAIPDITNDEIEKLVLSFLNNDEIAKSKLVESFLRTVVTIAKEYRNHGITVADLIQEGNIGLMQSLDSYKKEVNHSNFKEFITNGIRDNIKEAIWEQNNSKSFAKRMAERLTNLNHNIKELKEDLGKKPTIKEIADYMEIDIEEVKDMIRMSKEDDLEIDYNGKEL
ncbi:sigma-70 family RNA polymerase sigma factor [Anaeromicropila herbilytica]|uniref:RNA polymerase sigma-70 domain-containing protein n=1 Tax=Anaeromicropila herbilytica TaxID=2785025 RepID=A0A7R7EK45_9FIRM|nr:sigma-70 family RNA polymerase sigma factor [Anaeromicropila herbilytica]BCN30595.1 hypothetical protein bsdtb5_18900 [Anaeromicropila herbilytica]